MKTKPVLVWPAISGLLGLLIAAGCASSGPSPTADPQGEPGGAPLTANSNVGGSIAATAGSSSAGASGNAAGSGNVSGSGGNVSAGGLRGSDEAAGSGGLVTAGGSAAGTGGKGAAGNGAGGSPAMGGASGASGASYSPCMSKTAACKTMPLGDSITGGYRSTQEGGYRVELFHLALSDKKNITFVGSQSSGPSKVDGMTFPMSHEGHGGYTIAGGGGPGLQPGVEGWLSAAKPDIVTLMVGTNDVNNLYAWQTQTAAELAQAPSRLATLMDIILNQDSHLLLLVAQITPTTIDAENTLVQTYNKAIPALVQSRAAAGKHVILVDMYAPFVQTASYQTTLLRGKSDSLHPANAGYSKMGDVWYATLKSLLP